MRAYCRFRHGGVGRRVKSVHWYLIAAAGEIGGRFAFGAWLRLHKSSLWTIPGVVSLTLFALALIRVESALAGRVYAAYGGVYIVGAALVVGCREHTSRSLGGRGSGYLLDRCGYDPVRTA